jgi:hypothetical protein
MALQLQGQPNLQGVPLGGGQTPSILSGQNGPSSMGVQTPSPQVKTSNPPPIKTTVNDLSSKYANVNGTIYNKSSGQGYSDPSSFFKDSGVNSFNNLKFDTSWTPPTSTLSGLQMPGSTSAPSNSGLLASGSTGSGLLGGSSSTPPQTSTVNTPATPSPTNSAGLTTSQNPSDTSAAYPNAYTGTQSSSPTLATLSNQSTQLSTPSQQEVDLANKIAQYQNTLSQAESGTATVGDLEGSTGRQTAINTAAQATLQSMQNQLTNLQQQRQDALTGITNQMTALKPMVVSGAGGGTVLMTPTGQTVGQTSGLASVSGFPTGVNPSTGATGGMISSGATGGGLLGTPTSSGATGDVASAVTGVLTGMGINSPIANAVVTSMVTQMQANGGNPPASADPDVVRVAQQVLSKMTNGQYSSTGSAINLANQTAQSAAYQQILPIAKTALGNLSALQTLSNLVGYGNSPITNDIRNKLSGTAFTDPSITNLQGAIGVVAGELGQVLGGGDSTVASLTNAANSLPAGNISPQTLQGLISTLTTLVNNRLTSLSSPQNTVTVPNGLQMPNSTTNNNSTPPPAGTFTLH